jgi:hypothetical protein
MNCAEFDEIVHDLDRPGTPANLDGFDSGEPSLFEGALAHAESCSRCGRLLTEVEGLNFALHAIASAATQRTAPVRVEAALLREFRLQRAQRTGGRQPYRWYAAVAAVAAVALLALGLMRLRRGQPVRNAVVTSVSPLQTGADHARAVALNANTNGAEDAENSEDAGAFYSLPYADDSASLDGGAVIRVAVPRAALASWGLPVSNISGTGPIPADVVVSEDGTPQAIRLVSQTDE